MLSEERPGTAGQRLLVADALQRTSPLHQKRAESRLARHQEHVAPETQRGRFAHAVFRREVPGKDKETNWVPAPEGAFSLYIRAYWSEKAILDGTWMPPQGEKAK